VKTLVLSEDAFSGIQSDPILHEGFGRWRIDTQLTSPKTHLERWITPISSAVTYLLLRSQVTPTRPTIDFDPFRPELLAATPSPAGQFMNRWFVSYFTKEASDERRIERAKFEEVESCWTERVGKYFTSLFLETRDEDFYDGGTSGLGKGIERALLFYGTEAVDALRTVFGLSWVSDEQRTEALRVIGRTKYSTSHEHRRQFLEECLFSESPTVRDGAAIGLSLLRDPRSHAALMNAIEREPIAVLKRDMVLLLPDLADV